MSIESFLRELEQPVNADIEPVEKKFMENVKDRIQAVAAAYDESEVAQEAEWIRAYHKDFFDFSLDWTKRELQSNAQQSNHPDAAIIKKDAQNMLAGMQVNIVEFALAYMHINRFVTLLRDEIKKEEIKLGADITNMKWSSDVGNAIAKYRKRKRDIVAGIDKLHQARKILEETEPEFSKISSALITLFGAEAAGKLNRSLVSAFRTSDDMKVRKTLRTIKDTKKRFSVDQKTYQASIAQIDDSVARLQNVFTTQIEMLAGDDERLYLKPIETDLAYNGKIVELRQIKGFLSKYHLPYMQYKMDSLARLKEKMLVIGSMEALMTIYRQLLTGLAQPLPTLEEIRAYEDVVVNKAKYLLSSHFQEIPNIRRDAEKIVQEFRDGRKEFDEIQQMQLDIIEGVDEKSAKAAL